MNPAIELKQQLLNWTISHSGAECRTYLGMSRIGACSRQLYDELVYGRDWSTEGHLKMYLGYLHERDILHRLEALNGDQLGPSCEFSDFGGRFQGHSDGEWDGKLLEIKSTVTPALAHVQATMRVSRGHFWQAQTYMHYGRYDSALIVYVARDSGDIFVVNLRRLDHIGEEARLKAAAILEAVDARQPPECECGRCRNEKDQ